MVRHLDDLVQGGAPQLHVQVDGLHHLAQGQRRGHRLLRRGTGQCAGVRRGREAAAGPLRHSSMPTDEAYFKNIYYWNTPTKRRASTGGATSCTDFDAWTKAWTEITRLLSRSIALDRGLPGGIPATRPSMTTVTEPPSPRRRPARSRRLAARSLSSPASPARGAPRRAARLARSSPTSARWRSVLRSPRSGRSTRSAATSFHDADARQLLRRSPTSEVYRTITLRTVAHGQRWSPLT